MKDIPKTSWQYFSALWTEVNFKSNSIQRIEVPCVLDLFSLAISFSFWERFFNQSLKSISLVSWFYYIELLLWFLFVYEQKDENKKLSVWPDSLMMP